MPNWCDSQIKITGDISVNKLHKKLEKWIENEENNLRWLGNILEKAGFDSSTVSCRGYITDYYLDEKDNQYTLVIYQDTAWGPMNRLWQMIIEKYCPDAEFFYTAEEPGEEIYLTNDPDVADTYMLDWGDDCQYGLARHELFETLLSLLKKHKPNINFETEEISIDELIEMLENFGYEIYYHRFEFDEDPFVD